MQKGVLSLNATEKICRVLPPPSLPTELGPGRAAEPGRAGGTYISRFPGADMDLSSLLVCTSKGFPKERFLSMAFTRIFEEENRPVRTAGLTPGRDFNGATRASLIIQLTFHSTTAKSTHRRAAWESQAAAVLRHTEFTLGQKAKIPHQEHNSPNVLQQLKDSAQPPAQRMRCILHSPQLAGWGWSSQSS